MYAYYAAIFFLTVLVGGFVLSYLLERRKWNHGRCAICDAPWVQDCMDSSGTQWYRCACSTEPFSWSG